MKNFIIACAIIFTTNIFACPECGGFCDDVSKMPKIETLGNFIVYTDICHDLYEEKDNFILNLIQYNVIDSEADVVIWDRNMIVLKAKKKETIIHGKILENFETRIALDDQKTAVITVTCELVQ